MRKLLITLFATSMLATAAAADNNLKRSTEQILSFQKMSEKMSGITAAQAGATATQAGDLRIQFSGIPVGGTCCTTFAVKNTTGKDFVTVAWSCEFRDREGYKTGGGIALLHWVRNGGIAIKGGDHSFYNSDRNLDLKMNSRISITCKLLYTEDRNKDTEKLYPIPTLSEGRANLLPNDPWLIERGFWNDRAPVNGVAIVE
jgi:hypothetical protein